MCTCRLPKPVVTNWTSLHHPKKFLLCAWRQIYKFCTSGNFYDRHEVRIRLTLKHTHNALNIVISSLTSLHATISYIVLTSPLKLIVQMQRFMNRGYEKHTVAIATISIATVDKWSPAELSVSPSFLCKQCSSNGYRLSSTVCSEPSNFQVVSPPSTCASEELGKFRWV